MFRKGKRFNKKKKQFKQVYCLGCQQQKSCGKLDGKRNYCCPCFQTAILEKLEKDDLLTELDQQMLNDYRRGIMVCECKNSEKPRPEYRRADGSSWTKCGECRTKLESAGHHGVIKNRNDPRFWGLNIPQKILCGNCLENKKGEMTPFRRAEFNRYRKVRRL